ncbi:glutaredoxin family protein [uncultured Aquabacterium sp.]|uniref:glutaredoxin family protein n=1 Tax=Aquabacterium sp. TaxID=1872578 RepID=UPI0025CE44BC|nr:glutaredoxin family protein [uncultured Aquabacterium sp.]
MMQPDASPPQNTRPRRKSWLSLLVLLAVVAGASEGWSRWRDRDIAQAVRSGAAPGEIEMFTTQTCPYCAQARYWLDRHDISWRECNVDTTPSCRTRFEAQGAPGVPLMHVRGQWHLGFDARWLAEAVRRP